MIRTEAFSISAMGAYGKTGDGDPSLFIFAMLNDPPLGGPPCFFVMGLALGFGYNSKLNLPEKVDGVKDFILVRSALPPGPDNPLAKDKASQKADPAQVLAKLAGGSPPPIQPVSGEFWLAAGVRFTSFKFVQSFALLTVSFGRELEIALLGRSQISVPPDENGTSTDKIAFAEIDLMVRILPEATGDQPVFSADGKLASTSYVLTKDCHLTGGFAFYVWRDGDFVVTVGGYHPHFHKPARYPGVGRLGFSWQVDSHLSIKGGLYFALTPAALMAGGSLEAKWESGAIKAWYSVAADFIMYWHPFCFSAHYGIQMGVSVHIHVLFVNTHISVHLGVDLEMWGPPLGGRAHVDLSVASFTISFGAGEAPPRALTWNEFQKQFLPHKPASSASPNVRALAASDAAEPQPAICSAKAVDGLLKEDPEYGWIMNPQRFALTTHTAVPATKVAWGNDDGNREIDEQSFPIKVTWKTNLGIPPMNKTDIDSEHRILIEKWENRTWENWHETAVERIQFTANLTQSPAALWKNGDPNALADTTIENTLVGLSITPKPMEPDQTQEIRLEVLLYEQDGTQPCLLYLEPVELHPDLKQPIDNVSTTVAATSAAREKLVSALKNLEMPVCTGLKVSQLAAADSGALLEPPVFKGLG